MIEFMPITTQHRQAYQALLRQCPERGCEYSFVNLFSWGRQRIAYIEGSAVVFSQYNRKSVYLFPVGRAELKTVVDRIIRDARVRDIPCRFVGMSREDCQALEACYPGRFRFHIDRDSFDYLYEICDLALLKGRKYQKKRNHLNHFAQQHPDAYVEKISEKNLPQICRMVEQWYRLRTQQDPTADYHMEQAAVRKALSNLRELELEGMVLWADGEICAMTLGSLLSETTYDIHFEKALEKDDGAYARINQEFARYVRDKYPGVTTLNREDDMGIEGLRKAKCSYKPARMNEKYWACLLEDDYDY